jgi:class 3 adenylate cyclase
VSRSRDAISGWGGGAAHRSPAVSSTARAIEACSERPQPVVGVHTGETELLENGDIPGTSVNLAAPVQSSAEPGSIVVFLHRARADARRRGPDPAVEDALGAFFPAISAQGQAGSVGPSLNVVA